MKPGLSVKPLFTAFCLGIAGCLEMNGNSSPNTFADLGEVRLSGGVLVPDFDPTRTNYTVFLPYAVDTLTLSVTPALHSASVMETVSLVGLEAGEPRIMEITVYSLGGMSKTYSFTAHRLEKSRGLPSLYCDTKDGAPVESKEDWIAGLYRLEDSAGDSVLAAGQLEIKGRGNSTWSMPKKPYNLKLADRTALLDMPSHSRWNLLADYSDKTLLRNDLAFHLGGRHFDHLVWTPSAVHVDFFLNGAYQGVYQLVEQIRIDGNRVAVPDISRVGSENGGYILEVDHRMNEPLLFTSDRGVPVTLKDPNQVEGSVFEGIRESFQAAEDALYGDGFADPDSGYARRFDVPSFVDWYLINELTKNNDAIFHSSVYLHFDPSSGKFRMGPIWDFDVSSGNINYNGCDDPEGFWIRDALWIERLFEDPAFADAVAARWNEKREAVLSAINVYIPAKAEALAEAQRFNFLLWDILDRHVWPNRVVTGSYEGEVAELMGWLNARFTWLDAEFNGR